MATDTIRLDAPAAAEELALLRATKVGDVRKGYLIPAFDVKMQWECIKIEGNSWTFEGRYCQQRFIVVQIEVNKTSMVLTAVPL